ncbi:MAG: hypothetical protein JNK45_33995 [Myxococcales bacterium]|nr:hypothetical protein [Myxococcales bacterium]
MSRLATAVVLLLLACTPSASPAPTAAPSTATPSVARVDLDRLRRESAVGRSIADDAWSSDAGIDAELTIRLTAIAVAEARGIASVVDESAAVVVGDAVASAAAIDLTDDVRAALDPLAELAWVVGAWSATVEGTTTIETWCPVPATDQGAARWIGDNRTRKGEREVAFEWVAIEGQGASSVYLAQPSGRTPPARFDRVASDRPRAAVFENPAHDFPQRLEYLREGPMLRATASNQTAQLPFAWTRGGESAPIGDREQAIAAVPALARACAAIRERRG